MNLKKSLKRSLKHLSRSFGYDIVQISSDSSSYFETDKYNELAFRKCAEIVFREVFDNIAMPCTEDELTNSCREFHRLSIERGASFYPGSSGYNSLLAIYLVVKIMAPSVVVESGVYCGDSTWAIRLAAPGACINSFDLDLGNLRYTDSNTVYREHDWMELDWAQVDKGSALCFFDDHVDQVKRLLECYELGFEYALFDDNTPVEWLHLATDGAPMLDFIFDDNLVDGELIEWVRDGVGYSYRVNKEYLRLAEEVIETVISIPVPDLARANGYRSGNGLFLVKLRKNETI